jgi:Zn-dependent protease with chaperone function
VSANATPGSLTSSAAKLRLTAGATALIGVLVVAGTLGQTLARLHVDPHAAGTFHVLGLDVTAPSANLAGLIMLGLAALGAGVIVAGVRAGWRLERARRALLRSLPVAGPLPGRPGTLVVDEIRPLAFCTGYLRPCVYISRGAVARVSEEELHAVLAHEDEHRRRRDPLRQACARVLCDALFFLPVLRALSDSSAALAELLADDAAVAACDGDPAPLATAMLLFGTDPQQTVVGIAPERVDRLMGLQYSWRAPVLLALTSLAGIGSLALLTWQVGRQALVHTTLNLPLLSGQPCIVVLASLPLLALTLTLWLLRRVA